ncbi:unnamed protein product [Nesidiocoris tenuis]|uniref:Uncharacterized protein n=1 Tax=Nesidiocoris tenuis TaxID=355587 RepID=A0A6H5GDT9_9HEMI|nr:unnamed protein product [Nesidiocoris tenuis]
MCSSTCRRRTPRKYNRKTNIETPPLGFPLSNMAIILFLLFLNSKSQPLSGGKTMTRRISKIYNTPSKRFDCFGCHSLRLSQFYLLTQSCARFQGDKSK